MHIRAGFPHISLKTPQLSRIMRRNAIGAHVVPLPHDTDLIWSVFLLPT
jgi:hypothetical protein